MRIAKSSRIAKATHIVSVKFASVKFVKQEKDGY